MADINLCERTNPDGSPMGMVDKQGVCRFAGDLDGCRTFLRGLGLEIGPNPNSGWCKYVRPGVVSWLGMIEFWDGKFHAAAWKNTRIVWAGNGFREEDIK